MNMPGDLSARALIERALRVNHAGEYGAQRIYAGQLAVLGKSPIAQELKQMQTQETAHLDRFNRLLPQYRARPTALLPFWHVAGFALGAATAMLGEKTAMACTVAVETVIAKHYENQLRTLPEEETDLRKTISQFRAEEMEHHDTALSHQAEEAPLYPVMSQAIKTACKAAIWLSERV